MGKVRPDRVKKTARELISRFPNKFTSDFDKNKKIVETLTNVFSPRLRNRIAGYVVRLINIKNATEPNETEET